MAKGIKQRKTNCKRIVIYGPESTGKTTLAYDLANHYKTTWAPEYARGYLQRKWDDKKEVCNKDDLVDFGELLLKSFEVLVNHQSVKNFFHTRFQSVLIDEFQDTNTIQYKWLKEICSNKTNITAVGDDDQSIYGWRGAKVEHVNSFTKDFEKAEIVRLEHPDNSSQALLNMKEHVKEFQFMTQRNLYQVTVAFFNRTRLLLQVPYSERGKMTKLNKEFNIFQDFTVMTVPIISSMNKKLLVSSLLSNRLSGELSKAAIRNYLRCL